MAKLEIKKRADAPEHRQKVMFQDYDILIDGHEPSALLSLELTMNTTEFNTASITFMVDDLEVDADVLAELKAHVQNKPKKESDS